MRWGRTIIAVRNRPRTTEIELLFRPLDSRGRPRGKAPGTGHFIARLTGFANPAEYPESSRLPDFYPAPWYYPWPYHPWPYQSLAPLVLAIPHIRRLHRCGTAAFPSFAPCFC